MMQDDWKASSRVQSFSKALHQLFAHKIRSLSDPGHAAILLAAWDIFNGLSPTMCVAFTEPPRLEVRICATLFQDVGVQADSCLVSQEASSVVAQAAPVTATVAVQSDPTSGSSRDVSRGTQCHLSSDRARSKGTQCDRSRYGFVSAACQSDVVRTWSLGVQVNPAPLPETVSVAVEARPQLLHGSSQTMMTHTRVADTQTTATGSRSRKQRRPVWRSVLVEGARPAPVAHTAFDGPREDKTMPKVFHGRVLLKNSGAVITPTEIPLECTEVNPVDPRNQCAGRAADFRLLDYDPDSGNSTPSVVFVGETVATTAGPCVIPPRRRYMSGSSVETVDMSSTVPYSGLDLAVEGLHSDEPVTPS